MENNWKGGESERDSFWRTARGTRGINYALISLSTSSAKIPPRGRSNLMNFRFNDLRNRDSRGIADKSNLSRFNERKKHSRRASVPPPPVAAIVASAPPRLICSNWWHLIAYARAEVRRRQLRFSPEQKFESRAPEPRARACPRGRDSDIDSPANCTCLRV